MNGDLHLLSIIAFALAGALSSAFLKESRLPSVAFLLTLAVGCLILLRLLPTLAQVVTAFTALGSQAGVKQEYLALLLKVVALAYITELGAQLCRDAGQGATALKVELAGRLCILALALPVLSALVAAVSGLLS